MARTVGSETKRRQSREETVEARGENGGVGEVMEEGRGVVREEGRGQVREEVRGEERGAMEVEVQGKRPRKKPERFYFSSDHVVFSESVAKYDQKKKHRGEQARYKKKKHDKTIKELENKLTISENRNKKLKTLLKKSKKK